MAVHFYASRPHYVDHLAPIWHALDPTARGPFITTADRRVADRARHHGIRPTYGGSPSRHLTVVAGAPDLPFTRRAVLVEHGAGQTYQGLRHDSWSGGDAGNRRRRVCCFIVPNYRTAEANARHWPDAHYVIAAPRLEQLRAQARLALAVVRTHEYTADVEPPVARIDADLYDVVASRHWDSQHVPELRSAWPHYAIAIAELRHGRRLALHAHPRSIPLQRKVAHAWRVPLLEHFDDVVREAPRATYVIDNSSTAYEWAALDRPVVLLNAPGYRRHVHHGLRFWDLIPGPTVDEPDELEAALDQDAGWQLVRQQVTERVFPVIDGSAKLAARAIEDLA